MDAELFYPFADVTQLGQPYILSTPDSSDHVLASFLVDTNTAVSVYANVTMKTSDLNHYAQFQIAGVFCNKAGVLTEKFQSDTVMNRDNEQNKFYFVINGLNIDVVCKSGLSQAASWSGMVAIVPV